jgi:branched-subunit amino acid ABC-type transport system permease component
MSNQTMILVALAAVFLVLYLLRRRSRLGRDDD